MCKICSCEPTFLRSSKTQSACLIAVKSVKQKVGKAPEASIKTFPFFWFVRNLSFISHPRRVRKIRSLQQEESGIERRQNTQEEWFYQLNDQTKLLTE